MKKQYNFSKAKRGQVVKVPRGKSRITIRLDADVFGLVPQASRRRGRRKLPEPGQPGVARVRRAIARTTEAILRRVVREELRHASCRSLSAELVPILGIDVRANENGVFELTVSGGL